MTPESPMFSPEVLQEMKVKGLPGSKAIKHTDFPVRRVRKYFKPYERNPHVHVNFFTFTIIDRVFYLLALAMYCQWPPNGLTGILFGDTILYLLKAFTRFVCPPLLKLSMLVIQSTSRIKRMCEFVGRDGPESAVL
jgi:hypothetical protein